jgi:transcriptional regulator with XRE-family HTH domain
MTPEQCRAGRGALKWSGKDLARVAGLASNTVSSFECGRQIRDSSIARIIDAFKQHGVIFDGDGIVKCVNGFQLATGKA